MAASGYTSLSLYHSSTPAAEPAPGDLVDGELALNIADGKLFYKDDVGDIQSFTGGAGTSGYSGYSGYSGLGTSGFSGYSGQNGSASASGFSGYSGASGISGFSGATGTGTSGYSGYSGFSGYGVSGISGLSGFTITEALGNLIFKYNGTTVATLDNNGNWTTLGNITAYGTP
jgi:hypothetical protein